MDEIAYVAWAFTCSNAGTTPNCCIKHGGEHQNQVGYSNAKGRGVGLGLHHYTTKINKKAPIRQDCPHYRLGMDANSANVKRVLRVGQLIVVSLGRVLGEVLYEFPVIPFGIVEVDALPVGVRVRDSRFSVSCCFEPRAQ